MSGWKAIHCIICNVNLKLSSGKSDLIAHMECKKHRDAAKAINQPKINQHYPPRNSSTKDYEIRLTLFVVEHNLPFAVADYLGKVCQNSFADSNIAININMGKTKANAIIKNVVGKKQFEITNYILRNT